MEQDNLSSSQPSTNGQIGALSRIIMAFSSPALLFRSLSKKTDWIIPLIIIVIIGATIGSSGGYLVRPVMTKDLYPAALHSIEKWKDRMGEAQYNEIKAKIDESFKEAMENPFKLYYILTYLGFPFVISVVIAAICILSGNFIFGGKSNFWLIMNVVVFAALIGSLGDVIRGILMLLKDTIYVYTGLGLLKPIDDGSFIYYFLRQIDIFSVWRIAVTTIGLGVVYNMKPKRFAYVLFSVWIIFIALVALANMFTGGSIIY